MFQNTGLAENCKMNRNNPINTKYSLFSRFIFAVIFFRKDTLVKIVYFFPIFPLYYGGKTKFAPIHASDLTDIIFYVIENNIRGKKIETVGPKVLTFLEILNILSKCINKKRIFLPLPLFLAKFSAKILEKMPNPLLTVDQLNLLKYDNISSENNMNNFDLGSPSKINFEEGVMKYAYNWREGGQFSVKDFKKG